MAATTSYKVRFRALSFSMACGKNTAEKRKTYFPHASVAAGDIKEPVCVNVDRQITGVKPESILVKHDSSFNKFEVVIHLNKYDAKALREITKKVPKNGPSEKIFVGADGSIVISGYLN